MWKFLWFLWSFAFSGSLKSFKYVIEVKISVIFQATSFGKSNVAIKAVNIPICKALAPLIKFIIIPYKLQIIMNEKIIFYINLYVYHEISYWLDQCNYLGLIFNMYSHTTVCLDMCFWCLFLPNNYFDIRKWRVGICQNIFTRSILCYYNQIITCHMIPVFWIIFFIF